MPDQLDVEYCSVPECHSEGTQVGGVLLCDLHAALAKIAELERNNASYRDQIATMGQIRIEHPYGDPITIYQERLLAKRQEAIAALQQSVRPLQQVHQHIE